MLKLHHRIYDLIRLLGKTKYSLFFKGYCVKFSIEKKNAKTILNIASAEISLKFSVIKQ